MTYQQNNRPRSNSRPRSGGQSYSGNRPHRSGGQHSGNRQPRSGAILPAPEVLEAYELLVPGAKERLLGMAEKEMAHRHRMESGYLRAVRLSYRAGQLFSLLIAGYTLYMVGQLSGQGSVGLAILMAFLGFGYLFISLMVNKRQYGRAGGRNNHHHHNNRGGRRHHHQDRRDREERNDRPERSQESAAE